MLTKKSTLFSLLQMVSRVALRLRLLFGCGIKGAKKKPEAVPSGRSPVSVSATFADFRFNAAPPVYARPAASPPAADDARIPFSPLKHSSLSISEISSMA